ncbi:MAG: tetratricopeptide repeat protein [Myxococcales bacterium]|nr:tetratricopeptide repeat protein [Myxococcales bacterium]
MARPSDDMAADTSGLTPPEPPEPPEPPVLQDWTPLTSCLDWQIGQIAFQHRGVQAFTTQEVPNLINQGGLSAYRAAEVLFAHCGELEAAGGLEPDIQCMELAIGMGVHAVQLLDRFKLLCAEGGKDWYDRLTFWATDGTPRIVQDARDHGVFDRHAGHVALGVCNALAPATVQRLDDGSHVDLTGRLRGVFHTYLLCVLPANIFRRVRTFGDGGLRDQWSVIMARTVLRHHDELSKFTALTVSHLQALARSDSASDKLPLAPLYALIDLDLALAPVELANIDGGDAIAQIAEDIQQGVALLPEEQRNIANGVSTDANGVRTEETWVLHSAGAVHSLEMTLGVLRKDGFILYRDYGPATAGRANGNHLYQHYGSTTAVGINHFAIDGHMQRSRDGGPGLAAVTAPPGEGEASIKNRFVSAAPLPTSRAAFEQAYHPRAFDDLEAAVQFARQEVQRAGEAMDAYRKALLIARDNWALLGEAGEVALRKTRSPDLAHMLLTEALRINPWYNTRTWNNLGDLFWHTGEHERAREAYEKAVHANPEYYRGYLNLADCWLRRGEYDKAVEAAAQAVARDLDGSEMERSKRVLDEAMKRLQVQRELAHKWRRERRAGTPR